MLLFSKILQKWPRGRAPVEHSCLENEKCIVWKAPFHMRQVQFITLMTFFLFYSACTKHATVLGSTACWGIRRRAVRTKGINICMGQPAGLDEDWFTLTSAFS